MKIFKKFTLSCEIIMVGSQNKAFREKPIICIFFYPTQNMFFYKDGLFTVYSIKKTILSKIKGCVVGIIGFLNIPLKT